VKLTDVINELVEERGLDRSVLDEIIKEGLLSAYKKKYPELILEADVDKITGDLTVKVKKEVVSAVEHEDSQISLKKARFVDKKAEIGSGVWLPFEGLIGRVEVLRARQVIAQKIRHIEAAAVYNEFKNKEGEIVYGTIHKCERNGMVIKIDDALAFLPKTGASPLDKCAVGFPLRTLLKEVLPEPRNDNQLILDRTSELFLQQLFKLEIPEIFEKLIEIRRIVRIAGYKSKIAVASNDRNIDPVGTCVGVGGSRIRPILEEIGGEKIDVIPWSDSPEELIKNSLKPAKISRVEFVDKKVARVWLDEDQRSFAIGKGGQNIALASRLTGIDIQLVQEGQRQEAKSLESNIFKDTDDELEEQ